LGTSTGTGTDVDGFFELEPNPSENRLVISYVGYANDTIDMTDQKMVAITLTSNHILNEVEIKYRRKSTEVSFINPIKVQSIGEKELCKAACCNLSESFETNPSVDVSLTDAVTGTRKIQMLGLAGPNIQVMRENMPYIRGLAAVIGMEFTPGTWIEGIQLNQGTGSVVNGPESITGQINVELKKPEKSERLYLNLFANAMGRFEANLNVSQKVNEKWSTTTLLHGKLQNIEMDRNEDGFLDQPLLDEFIGVNRWRFKGDNGLMGQFGIKGTLLNSQAGQLTPDDESAFWRGEMNTERYEAWAKIGKVFEDRPYASIGFQISAMTHQQDGNFTFPASNQRLYNARHNNFYANLIYQSIIGNTDHTIKMGASYQLDDVEEDVFPLGTVERAEHMPGVFTEYQYIPNEKWIVVAGLRADYHNLWGSFLTPRVHVKYSPRERTAFRLAAGRGQRTAYIFAENIGLFASNREVVYGNDFLYPNNPEVAWNFGLNFTQEFMLGDKTAVWGIDYYYTHFTQQTMVDWDEDPQSIYFYALDGSSRSHSVQSQLDIEVKKGLDVRVAYRFNDPRTQYNSGLRQNPLTSIHRAFANIGWEIGKGWMWDGTINWQGSKRIPDTFRNPEAFQLEDRSPSFATVNMQISKTFNGTLDFYLGGENILNYTQDNPILSADNPFGPYFDASMIWGPVFGGNYYVGMRYKIF
jgi:outer membrane receptor protein involved in Fe transport